MNVRFSTWIVSYIFTNVMNCHGPCDGFASVRKQGHKDPNSQQTRIYNSLSSCLRIKKWHNDSDAALSLLQDFSNDVRHRII